MNKSVFIYIAGILAALLAFSGCAAKDPVAATVDGNAILQSEVEALVKSIELKYTSYGVSVEDFYGDEASKSALYEGVLESLIDRQLLLGIAVEKGMIEFTEAELAQLKATGEAELDTLRRSAQNVENVTLADMLALYGCTEKNYVDTYVDIAKYNRANDYLKSLAEPSEADYSDYYDHLLSRQEKTAKESPQYLGSYAKNGTLLYYPQGAVYVEYLPLGNDGILAGTFESHLLVYGEGSIQPAVVFPGTIQFSGEIVNAVGALAPGGETGRLSDENGTYIFRRLPDPVIPADWKNMPENMKAQVRTNVGEAYVEECLAAVRDGERVKRLVG